MKIRIVILEQQKTLHCESMLEIPNQTCWFSTKSSTEFLSVKGQSIVWLKQRAVQRKSAKSGPDGHRFKFHSPHHPPWHDKTECRQHF